MRNYLLARPAGHGILLCCILFLAGCVTLDHFAERATQYNSQVADVQDRTLLLNVMRGAERIPMHFTELSTLVGTGTFSATGTLGLPFATFHGGSGLLTATPAVTTSQSPTFNVAVLETQEFYKGMLAPLTSDQLAVYLNEGLPPELVFSLAFSRFIYQDKQAAELQNIDNNFHEFPRTTLQACGTEQVEYACFKSILRALMSQGLTMEQVHDFAAVGPPYSKSSFNDPKVLKELDAQSLQVVLVTPDSCAKRKPACPDGIDKLSEAERSMLLTGEKAFYRVQKEKTTYRLCFSPADKRDSFDNPFGSPLAARIAAIKKIPPKEICRNRVLAAPASKQKSDASSSESSDDGSEVLSTEIFMALQNFSFTFKDAEGSFQLSFQPRSTEGIIYYLGEIARCELKLDSMKDCPEVPKIRTDYLDKSEESVLFCVAEGKLQDRNCINAHGSRVFPRVEATLNGHNYLVNMDPSAKDRSGQVLRVVTQLLALNRSAKDFPTPAVVPLISR